GGRGWGGGGGGGGARGSRGGGGGWGGGAGGGGGAAVSSSGPAVPVSRFPRIFPVSRKVDGSSRIPPTRSSLGSRRSRQAIRCTTPAPRPVGKRWRSRLRARVSSPATRGWSGSRGS